MASPALASLLESIKLFMDLTYSPHMLEYDVLKSVDTSIGVSLDILKSVSKRIGHNDQRVKLVEHEIRLEAIEADYSLHEYISIDLVMKTLPSKADSIYLLSTNLLKALIFQLFSYEDQSYVIRSFHNSYIQHRSSDHKKCYLLQKIEVVDFVIAHSKSKLDLRGIIIDGSGSGTEKVTLARSIFTDSRMLNRFPILAWVTEEVSRSSALEDLLSFLMNNVPLGESHQPEDQSYIAIRQSIYEYLADKRYFIVIDNSYNSLAWDWVSHVLPDNKNGSRVLFTSNIDITSDVTSMKKLFLLHCEFDQILKMFHNWVFGETCCPQELKIMVPNIIDSCGGSMCSIHMVARYLSTINPTTHNWLIIQESLRSNVSGTLFALLKESDDIKTVESWKVVAKSVSSHVMGSENVTRRIFALSYEHLPDYLKSCFLYLGAFPRAYEIDVRRLIRLWIAEGFIANAHPKCMEDVAEEYLSDLIDRSLVLSGRRRSNGRLRTCRLHDLVTEFCVQEAQNEKFFDVIKDFGQMDSKTAVDGHHRFSFHCNNFNDAHLTASQHLAGSALFFGPSSHIVPDILIHYFHFRLLRVLDLISWPFDNFPTDEISKLLLLRYLALTASFELPGILFGLQKLQTLIINGPWLNADEIPELPREFWRSKSLRHFQLRVVNRLWSPELSTDASSLNFLQTLTSITLGSCTPECFSSIPNILKLGVCETREDFNVVGLWESFFQNLKLLESIQTLKISCFEHNSPLPLPSIDAFPKGLKKLTLRQCNLPWEAISLIGDLPNLEVLKLRNRAFTGEKWETREGGFQSLKYLLIEKTNLMSWKMEGRPIPLLEQLVLRFCEVLDEIPTEIANISSLTHIKLENCGSSVERSAKKIQEKCKHYSQNIKLQIRTQQTL